MSTKYFVAALTLVMLSGSHATAGPTAATTTGAAANRIVGLWITDALVGPCGGTPTTPVRNYLLFHAGGTLIENIPPNTVRNQGMGTWSYEGATREHRLFLRFDRFNNGVYAGYSTVERRLIMSADGLEMSGEVLALGFAPDGTQVLELCGEATSTRVQ